MIADIIGRKYWQEKILMRGEILNRDHPKNDLSLCVYWKTLDYTCKGILFSGKIKLKLLCCLLEKLGLVLNVLRVGWLT